MTSHNPLDKPRIVRKNKSIEIKKDGKVFVVHDDKKTRISVDPKMAILLAAALSISIRGDEYEDTLLRLESRPYDQPTDNDHWNDLELNTQRTMEES